jgi:hypothetical protein
MLASDILEAACAWQDYASKRFGESLSQRVTDIMFECREIFITEFLMQRGWRQIPGSKDWV